jgi:rhodanese-related sulfurtransferase
MRVVGLVLVLLCAACAEAAPGAVRAAGGHVSGTEGRALLAAGATLLDVRSPAEFAAGHLDGAVHVPVDELDARLGELPRDRPVVVYCRSGGRSARAASLLAAAGYEVHDLGGMANWD